jgi:lipopolysaccharide transport system permease protein
LETGGGTISCNALQLNFAARLRHEENGGELETMSAGSGGQPMPLLEIAPTKGWVALRLREFWDYRELLYFLTVREIKVRYKQTAIGAAWALIQPLFTMLIFSLFFGRLAKVPSDGVPYSIFCFTALVPWTMFANGIQQSSNSLVGNANLITKVYFPRLTVPISSVLSGLVDFALAFLLLLAFMLYKGFVPNAHAIWLPAFLFLAVVSSLGVGLWLSALNVEYRDIRYVVPFLMQIWLFATPVAYPSSLLKEPWRTIYGLNPMVGVVEGFRWALLGTGSRPGPMLAASSAAALVILFTGAMYFRRMERYFADII